MRAFRVHSHGASGKWPEEHQHRRQVGELPAARRLPAALLGLLQEGENRRGEQVSAFAAVHGTFMDGTQGVLRHPTNPLLLVDPEVRQRNRQQQLDGTPLPLLRTPISDCGVVPGGGGHHAIHQLDLIRVRGLGRGHRTECRGTQDAAELFGGLPHLLHDHRVQAFASAEGSRRLLAHGVMQPGVLLVHDPEHELVGVLLTPLVFVRDRPWQVAGGLVKRKGLVEGHGGTHRSHGVPELEQPMTHQQREADIRIDRHARKDAAKGCKLLILVDGPDETELCHSSCDGARSRGVEAVREHGANVTEVERLHEQRGLDQRRARELGRHGVFQALLETPARTQAEAQSGPCSAGSTLSLLHVHPAGPHDCVMR
mmetsp:Transcript_1901/g.5700  ORF Transcript_1901/g.5700 Transcript_1901/m.5700 type:complete len:370 (-) Transcript_1901:906-2015(-)